MAFYKIKNNKFEYIQTINRPASAPTYRRPRSAVKDKENKTSVKCKAGKTEQVDLTTEEREKVIDNLLERTKNLAGDKEVLNIIFFSYSISRNFLNKTKQLDLLQTHFIVMVKTNTCDNLH
jgi:hypothetical protein